VESADNQTCISVQHNEASSARGPRIILVSTQSRKYQGELKIIITDLMDAEI
jgi:hypothetical protein